LLLVIIDVGSGDFWGCKRYFPKLP